MIDLAAIVEALDLQGTLTPNRSMADLSWLKVGGPAEWLYQPSNVEDLQKFLKACPKDVPVMPVGVCSNMIIREGGIDGVVVRMGRGFNAIEIEGDKVRAGVAALDAHVARKAAEAGVDLAFLRTIPGAIGGAARMNAGCYGVYMADVFIEATALTRDGQQITLKPEDMKFTYRSTELPDDMIITSVLMTAPTGDPDEITTKMEDALAKREATQPTKERSCGSTFRNPAGFSSTGEADDVHDLKAWKLIDDAGLRGFQHGGAQMSEMHPNFLINKDQATAAEIEELGEIVRKKVYENSGISLQWEIKRIGKPSAT